MMQAYADDTGLDENSEWFLFSALIGEAENLGCVADEWDIALKESPSIRYFKMDEAESRDGQFYGFSVLERDAKVKRLCQIISSKCLTEFCFAVKLEVYNEVFKPKRRPPLTERYFFPFLATIGGVAFEVLRQGAKEPFEIIFDEQVIFGPRVKAWYPVMRAMMFDEPIYPVLPIEPFFRDDESALPLQAADLTAWVRRKGNSKEGLGEFEWMLKELSGLAQSPLSRPLSKDLALRLFEPVEITQEAQKRREVALQAYQETFGHVWPPKNKAERRRALGRIKKK
jgi:hypothetical protein